MQTISEKIADIYRAELAAGRKARTLDDVPGTYEAITAEWLTAVICRDTPGAEVVDFRVTDRSDGSSNRARIYLTYNDAGMSAGLPATVFCKGTVTLKNRILLGAIGSADGEANFFRIVRNRLDIETPVPYHAAYDPDTYAYIVVMKDIGATTHFCNEHTKIDREKADRLVTTLAKLHSRFYQSPELGTPSLPYKTWPKYWRGMIAANPRFAEFCDLAFGVAENVIPPGVFKRRAEIWPATEASVARHDALPRTLIHSDVHLGNQYIAGNGDMGLTDWQVATIGHWSRDFVYATVTALTIEDRRAWEEDLLRVYLDKMAELGAPKIDFNDAWFNIRQQLLSALAFWTITLRPSEGMPAMQPESISYELIKRLSTAMDDMDSLDTFR